MLYRFKCDYSTCAHFFLTWPGAATYRQLRAPQKTWQRCCRQLEHMTTVHQLWYYILRWSKLVQEKCHKTIKCHLSTTLSQCEFCQSCMMAGVSRWSAGKGDAVLLWGRGGGGNWGHKYNSGLKFGSCRWNSNSIDIIEAMHWDLFGVWKLLLVKDRVRAWLRG